MRTECDALTSKEFEYYNVIPLRSPAHTVDPSLPFPPPATDYADGSWTNWLNNSCFRAIAIFKKHRRYISGENYSHVSTLTSFSSKRYCKRAYRPYPRA